MSLRDLPFKPVGGQPAFDPAALERFVAAPRVAILSYARRDGRPNQVPIWYAYRDGRFLMLTSKTSPKAKALARDPRVCLTIQDETPPYRAVIIDGRVTLTDAEVTGGLHNELATRYFGKLGGTRVREDGRRREHEDRGLADHAHAGERARLRQPSLDRRAASRVHAHPQRAADPTRLALRAGR